MKHTLVIPTRNRPEYISVAVKIYLSSPRDDIRCLVCDASDNPEDVLSALSEFTSDKRLTIIDNTAQAIGKVSGMKANWSLALDNVKTKWVTVIGDDDVLYPELVDYICKLEKKIPDLPAIRWASAAIPVPPESDTKCRIPLGRNGILADTSSNIKNNFSWASPPAMPSKITGLYHGAVSLELLRKLKTARGSWFRYNYIDYEMGWIVANSVRKAVYTSRMFSINGFSPKSNSWATRSLDVRRVRARDWLSEGGQFDYFSDHGMPYIKKGLDPDFFFTLPVAIFGTMCLVADEIGINIDREAKLNFSKTLVAKGQVQKTETDFDWYMKNAKIFLSVLLSQNVELTAKFIKTENTETFSGLDKETLLIDRSCLPARYENLAKQINGLLVPVRYLD